MITEIRENVELLKAIKQTLSIDKYDSNELEELCEHLGEDDFCVDLDGAEYRFIAEDAIEQIYQDSIQDLVEDCYLALGTKEFPWWIAIDWEQTAKNCMVDGYGHHFSSYDGSEYEVENYYIFRVN